MGRMAIIISVEINNWTDSNKLLRGGNMEVSKKLEKKIIDATRDVNDILINKLPTLEYFSNVNFLNNIKTFKRVIIDDRQLLPDYQIAVYSSRNNTLYIDALKINDNISAELLEQIILHECIHMASTNLREQIIGFENELTPLLYNEACTQWLTLKLLANGTNFDDLLKDNLIYTDSVNLLNQMINEIGENVVFNHFFDADIKANLIEMPEVEKSKWLDEVIIGRKFEKLDEYQYVVNQMNRLNEMIDADKVEDTDKSNKIMK